jgi:hypothetical protein
MGCAVLSFLGLWHYAQDIFAKLLWCCALRPICHVKSKKRAVLSCLKPSSALWSMVILFDHRLYLSYASWRLCPIRSLIIVILLVTVPLCSLYFVVSINNMSTLT